MQEWIEGATFRLFNLLHMSSRNGCQAFLSIVFIILTKIASKMAAHMVCKGTEIFSSSSVAYKRVLCSVLIRCIRWCVAV